MTADSSSPAPPPSTVPKPISNLSAVADGYDTFIVDLWGVVHNGVQLFPSVIDCLRALMAGGKKVCLLTNAPRRVQGNIDKLTNMGLPRECYTALVSSGEAAHHALIDRPDDFHKSLGQRCFHLGPPRDRNVHEGTGLEIVATPEEASFILNTGIDEPDEPLSLYLPILQRAYAAGLPMVCANPDLVVLSGEHRAICAGTMAAAYEEMGGAVAYHGKPHGAIYHFALKSVDHTDGAPVLCIGDGFHTDLTGAARAGFDALFVTSGIHAVELDGTDASMVALIERYQVTPRYAIDQLVW